MLIILGVMAAGVLFFDSILLLVLSGVGGPVVSALSFFPHGSLSRYSFVASALIYMLTILPLLSFLAYLSGLCALPRNLSPSHCSLTLSSLFTSSFCQAPLSALTGYWTSLLSADASCSSSASHACLLNISSLVVLLIHSFNFLGSFFSCASTVFSFRSFQLPWLCRLFPFRNYNMEFPSLFLSLQMFLSLYLELLGGGSSFC